MNFIELVDLAGIEILINTEKIAIITTTKDGTAVGIGSPYNLIHVRTSLAEVLRMVNASISVSMETAYTFSPKTKPEQKEE